MNIDCVTMPDAPQRWNVTGVPNADPELVSRRLMMRPSSIFTFVADSATLIHSHGECQAGRQ